jgi:hypothetical protein
MTPSAVSGLASAIDLPVYVIAVVSPLDHPGTELAVVDDTPVTTNLANLAYWTGGNLTLVSAPAHAKVAARELVTELRHQYLLAFESAGAPGWYALDVRTRNRDLNVRARSGYFAGQPRRVGWERTPNSATPNSQESRLGVAALGVGSFQSPSRTGKVTHEPSRGRRVVPESRPRL